MDFNDYTFGDMVDRCGYSRFGAGRFFLNSYERIPYMVIGDHKIQIPADRYGDPMFLKGTLLTPLTSELLLPKNAKMTEWTYEIKTSTLVVLYGHYEYVQYSVQLDDPILDILNYLHSDPPEITGKYQGVFQPPILIPGIHTARSVESFINRLLDGSVDLYKVTLEDAANGKLS